MAITNLLPKLPKRNKKFEFVFSDFHHIQGKECDSPGEFVTHILDENYRLQEEEETGSVLVEKKVVKNDLVLFAMRIDLPQEEKKLEETLQPFYTKKPLPFKIEESRITEQSVAETKEKVEVAEAFYEPEELVEMNQNEKTEEVPKNQGMQIVQVACVACHELLPEGAKFCLFCGSSQEVAEPKDDEEPVKIKEVPSATLSKEKTDVSKVDEALVSQAFSEEAVTPESETAELSSESPKVLKETEITSPSLERQEKTVTSEDNLKETPATKPDIFNWTKEETTSQPNFNEELADITTKVKGFRNRMDVQRQVTLEMESERKQEIEKLNAQKEAEKQLEIEKAKQVFESQKQEISTKVDQALVLGQQEINQRFDQQIFEEVNNRMSQQKKYKEAMLSRLGDMIDNWFETNN